MEFTEKSRRISEDGLTTNTVVEYNIEGTIVEVDIPHFMATEEYILIGIDNRYITERIKLFPEFGDIDEQLF